MNEHTAAVLNCIISWGFLLYFLILFAERTISLVKSKNDSAVQMFGSAFDAYVNMLTILSLLATVILLAGFNGSFWASLFDGSVDVDHSMLTITAGIILFSGMVHTEHTIPPIQFTAYGMLIVSMVMKTILSVSAGQDALCCWYSMAHLTIFSMAVPVVYRSEIKLSSVFHILEAAASAVLVFCFTYMLYEMFIGKGEHLLLRIPILIVLVLDTAVVAMRWKENKNMFVLIFEVLSVIMFIVGKFILSV